MARPKSSTPTKNVVEVFDRAGKIIAYRWSTYYEAEYGDTRRKEGKVTVSAVLRQLGPKATWARAVKEAEAQAWSALNAFTAGNPLASKSEMTVQKWSEFVLDNLLPLEGKKPRSIIEIRSAMERLVYPRLGNIPITRVTPEMCIAWWQWLRDTEHPRVYKNKKGEVTKIVRKKISSKSADNYKGYFSTIMDRAHKMRKITFNPVDAIPINVTERQEHREAVHQSKLFLTPAMAKAIRKGAQGTLIYGHVLSGLDQGTRINEANGMLFENLRLDQGPHGVAYVKTQTQRYKKKGEEKSALHQEKPKTRAGYRPLLLSRDLRAEIDRRTAAMAAGVIPKSKHVFANSLGKPHSYSTMHEMFTSICRKAGIHLPPRNSTHIMRRYFLDMSKGSGVSEDVRAQVAGHERFETTFLQYEDVDHVQYEKLFRHVHGLMEDTEDRENAA
jgi:hypothetical protein